MSFARQRIGVLRSILEIFGISFARFRTIPRIWVIWLVAVNSAGLMFIGHIEAQVALAIVGIAVFTQALIYQRKRFIRILGVTHLLWLPMIAWMATRIASLPPQQSGLRNWLFVLIATNLVSLGDDAWDAARFLRGERSPHYTW
jgi:hypothetical protein